ncbi:MAG: ATP synthase F1 subunit gamma [Planctomycetes bacterium]|nr:ATP synthase F1 subunit gamma [Planctomycetota bacterium]
MANVKELRIRIKSVAGIAKITGAMEMVASMKLRKAQAAAQSLRPYTAEIRNLIDHLAEFVGNDASLPLFDRREVKTTGVLVISSDRGLCGAYNSNLLATFHEFERAKLAQNPGHRFKLYCYGKKGYHYLYKRGYQIEKFFVEPPLDKADFAAAKMVSNVLVDAFERREVDEVVVLFTEFVSVAKFVATPTQFLPIGDIATGGDVTPSGQKQDYMLEPDPDTIFQRLIPRYLETVVYDAILESQASEHASRRMAMKAASDAAKRMGKDLKKVYNRARQEGITKELLDIVGGASAV